MKKLLLTLLVCSIFKINAQLSGSAILSGQTNHAGIKVKFIPGSITSVSDSTTTDANGSYSINISGGIYSIVFSKSGFQTLFYNNNVGVVLTNTTTVPTSNLLPGNSLSVSGAVSGVWTSNTLYIVNDNINVPQGSTLTIQPGTQVKFNGKFSFDVYGSLLAIGNSGNKINFSSFKNQPSSGDWGALNINSTSSSIQHCIIEHGVYGLNVRNCSPDILFNEIRNILAYGIYLTNSSSLVKQNVIHNFNVEYSMGIASEPTNASSSPTIECNEIFDGHGRGINIQKGGLVKNNTIYNINGSSRGYGISCGYANTCRIENNYIHNCLTGISVGWSVLPVPTPTILNNTITENRTGILLEENYCTGTVMNNVIANNITGFEGSYRTPDVVSYNLMWNNSASDFSNLPITGIGQIANTNGNGDPVDSYFNVITDPIFVNNTPPFYSSASPCVGAGNALFSANIGCNPTAMCAGMVLALDELKSVKVGVFPNPFSSQITLSGLERNKIQRIRLYDLSGKVFETELNQLSESSVQISKPNLSSGIYLLEVSFSNQTKQYIKIVKE